MREDDEIKVTFWGVRGSYPLCKPSHDTFGGNTSCVGLELDDQYVFLDAGTGMISAGEEILKQGIQKATLLISHPHLDHINGLPFFKPIHKPDFKLNIISSGLVTTGNPNGGIESILSKVVSPPYYPVPWDQIQSQRTFIDVPAGGQFTLRHIKVSTLPLNHPGGSAGYRLDLGEKSICYITDTGHTPGELGQDLVEFINRTNLLIYDATFTEEEFKRFPTWGHSTWNQAVALAKAAAIRELALFHHNPDHDDAFMAHIETQARAQFSRTFVAKQGMVKVV